VPNHEPVATLTAAIGKPTEEADDAFEKIFSLRAAKSGVITAIWAVNALLATGIILTANLICFHFTLRRSFSVHLPNGGLSKTRLKELLLPLKKITDRVQGTCEPELCRSLAKRQRHKEPIRHRQILDEML
jgi:hypothetical protein